jgi:NitT/TauT family transport system substrate-binding protein
MRIAASVALTGLLACSGSALALDKVTFGTNWLADPEAGG